MYDGGRGSTRLTKRLGRMMRLFFSFPLPANAPNLRARRPSQRTRGANLRGLSKRPPRHRRRPQSLPDCRWRLQRNCRPWARQSRKMGSGWGGKTGSERCVLTQATLFDTLSVVHEAAGQGEQPFARVAGTTHHEEFALGIADEGHGGGRSIEVEHKAALGTAFGAVVEHGKLVAAAAGAVAKAGETMGGHLPTDR